MAPRFYCTKLRCTNPAANDVEITCPVCGRAYQRCFNHDGEAGARRSLRSHAGLYGHSAITAAKYSVRVRILGEAWQPSREMTLKQMDCLIERLTEKHGSGAFEILRSQKEVG